MPVFTVTALLFDCDGVLVDSLDAAAVAWNEWGTRWKPGFDFHRDVEHGRRLTDYVAELVGPEDAAEAAAELAALERDHAVDVHGIPGAAALLANLPAGRWAVVTSGTRDIATARLIAAGIPTPAVLVTADDVAKGKPSPIPICCSASARPAAVRLRGFRGCGGRCHRRATRRGAHDHRCGYRRHDARHQRRRPRLARHHL